MGTRNPRLTLAVVAALVYLVFLAGLETTFRAVTCILDGPAIERAQLVDDAELGWVHNVRMREQHSLNRCGEEVRRLPSPHPLITKLPKFPHGRRILFIGDSFTHAAQVSSGKAYYDVFGAAAGDRATVYAAGVTGYGSLQEYLMLREVYPEIEPDIVVWQLCGNDPGDNVFELDDSSLLNNQRQRPYLDLRDGTIAVRNPGFWLHDVSQLYRFLFGRVMVVDRTYDLGLFDLLDAPITLTAAEAREAEEAGLRVLDDLLQRCRSSFPGTRMVGFATDAAHEERYREIFAKHGYLYLDTFYESIDRELNTNCWPLDGHWNHRGNYVAGVRLYRLLCQHGLLDCGNQAASP
jgi:hypothetical protein